MSDDPRDFHPVFQEMPATDEAWRDAAVSPSVPPCAPVAPAASAVAVFDFARIVDALPRLGAVLWLDRRERSSVSAPSRVTISARGVLLLEHPALAALDSCRHATAHIAVTSRGPREWLCFRDDEGVTQSKLFLLPDTDYLAWDEMVAAGHLEPVPSRVERWQPHGAFLRAALACLRGGWRARLLTFHLRRLPWLRTLGAQPPLRISLIGLELARAIAQAEGAEFVSPLHAA